MSKNPYQLSQRVDGSIEVLRYFTKLYGECADTFDMLEWRLVDEYGGGNDDVREGEA